MMPAMRATPSTSPLAMEPLRTIRYASGAMVTVPAATARRTVSPLAPTIDHGCRNGYVAGLVEVRRIAPAQPWATFSSLPAFFLCLPRDAVEQPGEKALLLSPLAQFVEMAQQLLLFLAQAGGRLYLQLDDHIAAAAAVQAGHALAAQGEVLAGLGPSRDRGFSSWWCRG